MARLQRELETEARAEKKAMRKEAKENNPFKNIKFPWDR
jgi:hypothetical protein